MGDGLRGLLEGRATKLVLGLVAAVVAGVFVLSAWRLGSAADGCADSLVVAIGAGDRADVEGMVRNPSVRDQLLAGDSVEVGFVRPMSSAWTRVGLFVKTGTTTTNVALQLSTEDGSCLFLRDYER